MPGWISFKCLLTLLKGLLLVAQSAAPTTRSVKPADPELEDELLQVDWPPAKTPALLSAEPPSITEHTTRELESSKHDESERTRTTQPTSDEVKRELSERVNDQAISS
jgi:hypothetical protein